MAERPALGSHRDRSAPGRSTAVLDWATGPTRHYHPFTEESIRMDRKGLAAVLLELLEEETGEKFPDLDDVTNLRDGLHLDSLDLVSLILHIETRLQVHIDSSELDNVTKVGDLLDLLQTKLVASAARHAA